MLDRPPPPQPRVHELAARRDEYAAIAADAQRAMLCPDNGYRVGDHLLLHESDPLSSGMAYTERTCRRCVTHVQHGGRRGLSPGWVALSLEVVDQ